jgi:hypothetical protein
MPLIRQLMFVVSSSGSSTDTEVTISSGGAKRWVSTEAGSSNKNSVLELSKFDHSLIVWLLKYF